MYCCCALLCTTNKSGGGRATAGERWMWRQQIQQQYIIRVGGSVVGVNKISFFIHESHPGVVLLLMYQQKCTAAHCCVQPTRAAPGEKCSSSTVVVRVGRSVVGVHKISFFIHEPHLGMVLLLMYQQKCTAAVYCCVRPTRAAAGERRRASDVCAHSKYSSSSIVAVRVGRSVVGAHHFFFFYSRVTLGWYCYY